MILLLCLIAVAVNANDFVVTLSSSAGKDKVIPRLQPCSCQLSVFPVYDRKYRVNVQLPTEYTQQYLQISIPSQEICRNIELKSASEVSIDVEDVNFAGETEVTEQIYIKLITQEQECEGETGEARVVYLVDKDEQSEYNYGIYLPQDAVIFTQILAFAALIGLCSNIKYRRIPPVRFGYVFAIFYPVFLFAIVYVSGYLDSTIDYAYYGSMLFSLVFVYIYFADILSCCSDKPLLIYSLAAVAGVAVVAVDMFVLVDAWFVNDFIAIFVTGTITKFVVIKKMRTSIIPLILFWLFFVFRQFAIDLRLQNFEQAMEIRIIPLFLQLPTLFSDSRIGYPCSAFGTSKIVTMGLIVNYAIRIDLFLSGHFYTLIVSAVALLCMVLEVVVAVVISELPVVEYLGVIIFIPVASIVMLLSASKRGEWAEIWHGSFHDIAVDRKSVKRESTALNEEEINRNLEQLEMNPSLLSDN